MNSYPAPSPENRVLALTILIPFYYIKNLDDVLFYYVDAALFADDAFLWSADPDLNTANSKVQTALDKVLSLAQRPMKPNVGYPFPSNVSLSPSILHKTPLDPPHHLVPVLKTRSSNILSSS